MRLCVLSGSPKGALSVTLQSVNYLSKRFPEHEFSVIHGGQRAASLAGKPEAMAGIAAEVAASDAVILASPLYYQFVPGQFMLFLNLLAEEAGAQGFSGKPAMTLTTSIHYYDHLAHAYLRQMAEDMGMRVFDSFSPDMDDLKTPGERDRLELFADAFFTCAANAGNWPKSAPPLSRPSPLDLAGQPGPPAAAMADEGASAVIVADGLDAPGNLRPMVERLAAALGPQTQVVDLAALDMKSGCMGCVECGLDNRCAFTGKDEVIQTYTGKLIPANIVVYAGTLARRFFSPRFKSFIDRSFFHNHAPIYPGKQMAWLVSGGLSSLPHVSEMMTSYPEMSKASLAGIVCDEYQDAASLSAALDDLAQRLATRSASGLVKPPTFLSVAGHKLFRDDIYSRLRFVFQADHHYYLSHGMYDFPQKDLKSRLVNALVIPLSKIPAFREKLRKMIKTKMVEPHQKIVAATKPR